ncbi:MAG: C40 family peptidase [Flavobacteriaceae bacterium]
MKKLFLLFSITLFFASCGTSKKTSERVIIGEGSEGIIAKKNTHNDKKNTKKNAAEKTADETVLYSEAELKTSRIIEYAKTFEGTRYKFGGTDNKGMDCSGLVCTSFKNEDIALPRISRDMATQGIAINLEDSKEGDLLFFQTNSKKKVINHVGLVVETKDGEIFFIHSTVKKGVIISSMEEPYWKNTFVKVRRII